MLETFADDLRAALDLAVAACARVADLVLPAMRAADAGALLLTTGRGALAPSHDRASSGVSTTAQTMHLSLLQQAVAGWA